MDPQLVNMAAYGQERRMAFLLKLFERKNQAALLLERTLPDFAESPASPADQSTLPLQQKQNQELEFVKLEMKCLVLDGDFQLVDSLLFLEAKQRRIWDLFTEVPTDYLDRFNSLEELLRYPGNFLARPEGFSVRGNANS